MSENYKSFTNKNCEYFPCHKGVDEEIFNCLFCYCPLYALKDKCGGNFSFLENGIKNCANCTLPHGAGGYDHVMNKMGEIMDLGKKNK